MRGAGGDRTNGEEMRLVSESGGGFLEDRVQVDKNPYPVGMFPCWEMYREILARVAEVCELGDTPFVEKVCVGSVNLQYCGELKREATHEEVK